MKEIKYTVVRSRRKSISAKAEEDGVLVVRAPLYAADRDISEFIEKYRERLAELSEKAQERCEKKAGLLSAVPSQLPYRGTMADVVYTPPFGIRDGVFHLPERPLAELVYGVKDLYRQTARALVIPRAIEIAGKMNAHPSAFKINYAAKRWGSCSGKGSVNFSAMLCAADDECIEYVIVHELCHLTYMDHSKAFWAMVERYLPDRREREKRLDGYGELLREYGLD